MADPDDAPPVAEATVTNADYWASRSLDLAAVLSSGVILVGDPTGQPTDPERMAVVVDPAWWAAQPRELADALGRGSAQGSGGDADAGTASGAITTGGDRLTLAVEEAAAALGISRASGYEAARRGEIPCIRIGRRILVPRIALDRLLAAALPDPSDGAEA